jgi:transcriptional regulator with XRE-family HTH domain
MPRRPKPVDEQLRQAIAKARRNGMTWATLCEATGMSISHARSVADGRTIPRLDTAENIANALNLKLYLDE